MHSARTSWFSDILLAVGLLLTASSFCSCVQDSSTQRWQPSPAGVELSRAVVFIRRGDHSRAVKALEKARELQPDHAAIPVIEKRIGAESQSRKQLAELEDAFMGGDIEKAGELFDALIPGGQAHTRALELGYERKLEQSRELHTLLVPTLGELTAQKLIASRFKSPVQYLVEVRGPLKIPVSFIPAGEYIAGSCGDSIKCLRKIAYRGREDPLMQVTDARQHMANIPRGMRIGMTEVSVALVAACVEAGACELDHITPHTEQDPLCNWGREGAEDHPINCIDYEGALSFCRWAGGSLPSEIEWERAARGAGAHRYPWGFRPPTCLESNHAAALPCRNPASTIAVHRNINGISPYGLFNMSGNVAEWTRSPFVKDSYKDVGEVTRPYAQQSVRGGSFQSLPKDVRSTSRKPVPPETRAPDIGFRCSFR